MSDFPAILDILAKLAASLGDAQADSGAADEAAGQARDQAAALGNPDWAGRLGGVQSDLNELQGQLSGVGTSTGEATAAVTRAASETRTTDVVSTLEQAAETVKSVSGDILAAAASRDTAESSALTALDGNDNPAILGPLTELGQKLEQAAALADQATSAITAAITAANQVGAAGG